MGAAALACPYGWRVDRVGAAVRSGRESGGEFLKRYSVANTRIGNKPDGVYIRKGRLRRLREFKSKNITILGGSTPVGGDAVCVCQSRPGQEGKGDHAY